MFVAASSILAIFFACPIMVGDFFCFLAHLFASTLTVTVGSASWDAGPGPAHSAGPYNRLVRNG